MQAFAVTLREGFEAALVVGMMLAFLQQSGRPDQNKAVWAGVAAAVGLSALVGAALFLSGSSVQGESKELFEGLAMMLAALLVTWMVFWMKRQAAANQKEIKGHLRLALESGSSYALGGIAFVAVGRECLESTLFLFAAASSSGAGAAFIGAFAGLLVSAALGVLVYKGAIRISLEKFFFWTGIVVIAFASWLVFSSMSSVSEALDSQPLADIAPTLAAIYGAVLIILYWAGPESNKGAQPEKQEK